MMIFNDEYYKPQKKNIFGRYKDNTEAHRQRIAQQNFKTFQIFLKDGLLLEDFVTMMSKKN